MIGFYGIKQGLPYGLTQLQWQTGEPPVQGRRPGGGAAGRTSAAGGENEPVWSLRTAVWGKH